MVRRVTDKEEVPPTLNEEDDFFSPWLYSPWRTLAASHIGGFFSYLDRW
jgi:hypothetical protein